MPEWLDFGKNTVFILSCYGLSALCFAVMAMRTMRTMAHAKKLLRAAETQSKKP